MATRIVEVIAGHGVRDILVNLAHEAGIEDVIAGETAADGRQTIRLIVGDGDQQKLLDRIQSVISGTENWRIVILPVDATIPKPSPSKPSSEAATEKPKPFAAGLTREELYQQVESGARLDRTYLLLVFLSTVVAAIGLAEANVAVIIGAMVIAPLLGPSLAFAFATAIGEHALMIRAITTSLVGLGFSLILSIVIGFASAIDLNNAEIATRTVVGFDSIALALASGGAAALSLTTGLSSALVGVMVAVALLPPAATLGMLIGAAELERAAGAALLLAVNVVCVTLAAQIVFIVEGIRPRTWFEAQQAKRSALINAGVWLALLLCLSVVIYLARR